MKTRKAAAEEVVTSWGDCGRQTEGRKWWSWCDVHQSSRKLLRPKKPGRQELSYFARDRTSWKQVTRDSEQSGCNGKLFRLLWKFFKHHWCIWLLKIQFQNTRKWKT